MIVQKLSIIDIVILLRFYSSPLVRTSKTMSLSIAELTPLNQVGVVGGGRGSCWDIRNASPLLREREKRDSEEIGLLKTVTSWERGTLVHHW